jgi:ubiquinone/menaquinone biosynthesis C-methylase UbiE
MNHKEVAGYWNQNAEAWTRLSRAGFDVYRDYFNTPCFLRMLPDVRDLRGLDIGCGEGHNTRLLAGRGARMDAVDISDVFINHARQSEFEEPLGIAYQQASAAELPFSDQTFDFVTGFMSFMDIPETEKVILESYRVLKPGGFLQFSITHPCFQTSRWKWILDEKGNRSAMACGDYFSRKDGSIDQWMYTTLPDDLKGRYPDFRIPRFDRTLSFWLNLLIETGFTLEQFEEPYADDEAIRKHPTLADSRIIAYFLHLRCRKK